MDRRVNLIAVAWCINALAFSITFPFLPIYLHAERGYPMELVGLMFPIMGLGRILGPMVSGHSVDRLGSRRVIITSTIARGLTFCGLVFLVMTEASFWALAGLLFTASFFGEFFTTASDAYVTGITTNEQRREAFSRLRVGLNTGWMIGPAVGAFLARTPFTLLFGITAFLCLATAWVVFWYCPESNRSKVVKHEVHDPGTSFVVVVWRDRTFMLFLVAAFLCLVTGSQLITTLPIFSTQVTGISSSQLGILYALNGLLVIALQLPLSRACGTRNLTAQLALGAALTSTGFFLIGFCTTYWHYILAMLFFTVGEIFTFSLFSLVCSRLAPPHMVGRYIGLYRMVFGIAYALGPWLGAFLFARLAQQPVWLWGTLSIWAAVAAVGFWFLPRARIHE